MPDSFSELNLVYPSLSSFFLPGMPSLRPSFFPEYNKFCIGNVVRQTISRRPTMQNLFHVSLFTLMFFA